MYTFPRKWHSQKKKKEKKIIHNLDHSQPQPSFDSQSNLNFSPKFSYTSLLFLSHTNHTQVFRNFTAKVRSQIVKPWPQLHLAHREWLENANSFPFKTTRRGEGGDDAIPFPRDRWIVLYTGFLKDLDLLNFAGVVGMTRGNEVPPRGRGGNYSNRVLYNSSSHLNALGEGVV